MSSSKFDPFSYHREAELAVVIALVISVGNFGGIIGPNVYGLTAKKDTDSTGEVVDEDFMVGHLVLFGLSFVLVVASFGLWKYLRSFQMGYEVV